MEKKGFLALRDLLVEMKDNMRSTSNAKHLLILDICVPSQELIDRFEEIFDCLDPGIAMNINVPYKRRLKKEFERRAKKLGNDRGVMSCELDEINSKELQDMDIKLVSHDQFEFGSSWYPEAHWYDWIPNYQDAKIQITVPKATAFPHIDELLKFVKTLRR
jgi:hypothetical protein